jgi:hypothetical protein
MSKTLAAFVKFSHLPASLVRAVVRQHGSWSSFQEDAQDISSHGADTGWGGWTYTADTTKFTKANRALIVQALSSQAADLGEDLLSLVAGFNCLRSYKPSVSDVGRVLFSARGGDEDTRTNIENALAWSALEDVARAYVDWCEQDQD